MTRQLLFASTNAHKIKEAQHILGERYRLLTPSFFGIDEEIAETGSSFRENALIKATGLAGLIKNAGMDPPLIFADDSGLEIEALNNEPGVWSARYAGSRDMQKNINLVLAKMKGITHRNARFVCSICLLVREKTHSFEAFAGGTIREEKSGETGFGYDPIFQPFGFIHTYAEMDPALKDTMSHRAKALQAMEEFLRLM